jgi:hypothetical protein
VKKLTTLAFALAVMAMTFVACGGSEPEAPPPAEKTEAAPAPAEQAPAEGQGEAEAGSETPAEAPSGEAQPKAQ